jgi:hypothetical protein
MRVDDVAGLQGLADIARLIIGYHVSRSIHEG